MQTSDDLEPSGAAKPDREATFLRLLVEAPSGDDNRRLLSGGLSGRP